ncbi:MAG: methyltransferase domain-containing protein [Deltaproteobacteria bacterium]|nr:methyltransferase domain-containing protein [Deltaproteobacteria bacterium]
MKQIANFANYLRSMIERRDEFQEPSGGFLPYRVRQKTVSLMTREGRTLDVGAGEGLLLKALGPQTEKLFYGIDCDKKKLAQSAARSPNKARTLFIYGDGLSLPFQDSVFNEVTLLNMFLNIPDEAVIASLIQEAFRVCKANGKVLFDYRNNKNPFIVLSYKTVSLHDPELKIPLRGFTRGELQEMLRSRGIQGAITYHPIPSWWRLIPPAYLVEIQKKDKGLSV